MCVCLFLMLPSSPATATAADQTQKLSSESLRNEQLAVSGRYDRFERLLSQMADILGHEDPERAELLRRAISKGREKRSATNSGKSRMTSVRIILVGHLNSRKKRWNPWRCYCNCCKAKIGAANWKKNVSASTTC
jgi:hypothetical protein